MHHPPSAPSAAQFGRSDTLSLVNGSAWNTNTAAPPGTGPWFSCHFASDCRYASSCRRMALRSSGVHESLHQRPFLHRARHARCSARLTKVRTCESAGGAGLDVLERVCLGTVVSPWTKTPGGLDSWLLPIGSHICAEAPCTVPVRAGCHHSRMRANSGCRDQA